METNTTNKPAYPTFAARAQAKPCKHEKPAAPQAEADQVLIDFSGAAKTQSYGGSKCSTC